ncbi:MAG: hypothetical protein GXP56_07825 [Deltaproteobacteria bacterium]|nr:hypothetical protein [Deltaproteobacteria bacterium]
MTDATVLALDRLRDLSMLKWYVIPFLSMIFYIYTREIKEARETGNWNAVFAGLTIFGVDFFNETLNSWIMVLSGRSALWTTPGDTALRTMVGWNIEIMFMFSIMGIVYFHSLNPDRGAKIFGISDMWFWAVAYSAFSVFIECFLNMGGHLVWEYSFWERSFKGIWLIFLFGYFHFFCAAIFVITRKAMKTKLITIGIIYLIPVLMNILGKAIFKWNY